MMAKRDKGLGISVFTSSLFPLSLNLWVRLCSALYKDMFEKTMVGVNLAYNLEWICVCFSYSTLVFSQQPSPIRRPRHSCGMKMPGWISPPCSRSGYLCTSLCPWLMGNCQTLAHHPDRTIGLLLSLPRWSEAGLPLAITGTFCFKPAGSSWGSDEKILPWLDFISTVSMLQLGAIWYPWDPASPVCWHGAFPQWPHLLIYVSVLSGTSTIVTPPGTQLYISIGLFF